MKKKPETEATAKTVQAEIEGSVKLRSHENYFGLSAETFVCPNEFELFSDRLRFNFDAWISVESFEAGESPIARLQKEFMIKEDFPVLKAENPLFGELSAVALKLCGVGGRDYSLHRLYITTVGKFLTIDVSSADGDDKPSANKYGGEFDAVIAANLELITGIVTFMVAYGKSHDEFLALSRTI